MKLISGLAVPHPTHDPPPPPPHFSLLCHVKPSLCSCFCFCVDPENETFL